MILTCQMIIDLGWNSGDDMSDDYYAWIYNNREMFVDQG